MPAPLVPGPSSVGTVDRFSGNFTKALYLRSQPGDELERRLGYGPGRLSQGWWLLFALERPAPDNFEFGGYTHFSGSRIGDPGLGTGRPHVEQELQRDLGGPAQLLAHKGRHSAGLKIDGPERLAKVLPVARGADYPVGAGIYQCNIPRPITCKVAAFVAPGGLYLGNYD